MSTTAELEALPLDPHDTFRPLLSAVQAAEQDFEWYPTTDRMIAAVARRLRPHADSIHSILDIGAGDGRVLTQLGQVCKCPTLYSIEKSTLLISAQPDDIIPVGTNFFEQNLNCLPVDCIFSNPPYSEYEAWAAKIIEEGYAQSIFLVIPQRWKDSGQIAAALKRRSATAKVIHSDDFLDADRRARAVVDVIEVTTPRNDDYHESVADPFDIWFDQNISTFDQDATVPDEYEAARELARIHRESNISDMVAAYIDELGLLERNYKAIFKLDRAILDELGVSKGNVREGIKKKMAGLKAKYWQVLFDRLDAITSRLSTKTKARLLEKLTRNTSVAFTVNNAYAVVLWAVKNANKYYDEQLVTLFRDLSTFEGVHNYKSNTRTWQKNGWRYGKEDHDHYTLDYRIVVSHWGAMSRSDYQWEYPGKLHKNCHEEIADIIAVMANLGFLTCSQSSFDRQWVAGQWQDFCTYEGDILFQAKAHINGNLHYRFMPKAIKRLNVEAGRLLGWVQNVGDVVRELGYSEEEAREHFGSSAKLLPSNIRLLANTDAQPAAGDQPQPAADPLQRPYDEYVDTMRSSGITPRPFADWKSHYLEVQGACGN